MIRVVVIDDHPALRAGLHTVLESEPGIVYAGESDGGEESLWPLLRRVEPDVVLLDYHLPKGDGLQLCYRIKQNIPAPAVIIFSAYASPDLLLPAQLAKADGSSTRASPHASCSRRSVPSPAGAPGRGAVGGAAARGACAHRRGRSRAGRHAARRHD